MGRIRQQAPHPLSGALFGGHLSPRGGGRKGGPQGLGLGEFADLGKFVEFVDFVGEKVAVKKDMDAGFRKVDLAFLKN